MHKIYKSWKSTWSSINGRLMISHRWCDRTHCYKLAIQESLFTACWATGTNRLNDKQFLVNTALRFHVDQITSIKPMNLMAYGCQCQIMSESSFGQSKDELDKVCIGWHQCRKCVSIDNQLLIGSRNCDPKSDKYQIGVNVDTGDLSCQLSGKISNILYILRL